MLLNYYLIQIKLTKPWLKRLIKEIKKHYYMRRTHLIKRRTVRTVRRHFYSARE